MSTCVCVRLRESVRMCFCACLYVYLCVCLCVCLCAYMCMCMRACDCEKERERTRARKRLCLCVHVWSLIFLILPHHGHTQIDNELNIEMPRRALGVLLRQLFDLDNYTMKQQELVPPPICFPLDSFPQFPISTILYYPRPHWNPSPLAPMCVSFA